MNFMTHFSNLCYFPRYVFKKINDILFENEYYR